MKRIIIIQRTILTANHDTLLRQNDMLLRLHREREEQMRLVTSQLLLLEANLRAKQSKIDVLLNQRDRLISSQQETIRRLEGELDRYRPSSSSDTPTPSEQPVVRPQGLSRLVADSTDDDVIEETAITPAPEQQQQQQQQPAGVTLVRVLGREQGDESLDDSDSAVVIEDDQHHRHSPTFIAVQGNINPQVGAKTTV